MRTCTQQLPTNIATLSAIYPLSQNWTTKMHIFTSKDCRKKQPPNQKDQGRERRRWKCGNNVKVEELSNSQKSRQKNIDDQSIYSGGAIGNNKIAGSYMDTTRSSQL